MVGTLGGLAARSRAISLVVTINGAPVTGIERLELVQCGHFAADRFRVWVTTGATPGGAATYASLQAGIVTIGIEIGALGVAGSPLLTGQIDNIVVDFSSGHVVLSGRDLSARLIDSEVVQSFSNQTASQIATIFAADAGLDANIKATSTPVGQYYELAHMRTGLGLHTRHVTRWDLLASFAAIEQFSLSVTGTILNFGPPTASAPMLMTVGQDFLSLMVDRALSLVEPKVTVSSWNPKSKQSFSGSLGTTGGVTLVRPNLTQAEVNQEVTAQQTALAAQAVLLRASIPGELSLAPGSTILLQGTNTSLDQTYVVRTIERSVDMHKGFIQRFEALQVS